MDADTVALTPTAKIALLQIAATLGRPIAEVLEAAIGEYRHRHTPPVTHIEGIDPAEIWAASASADAGNTISHEELFARLRARP